MDFRITRYLSVEFDTSLSWSGADCSVTVIGDLFGARSSGKQYDRTETFDRICEGASSISELKSFISRTIGEFYVVVESVNGIHIVRPEDEPKQDLILKVITAVSEFETEITRHWVREETAARRGREDYHHGPAPSGFKKYDGALIEAPEYDRVYAVLDVVNAGELSKHKAPEHLNTSRATINRSLNLAELCCI